MNPVAYLPQSRRLLEQVSEVIRYKDYSLKTEQAYVYWGALFCPMLWAGLANAASARHGRLGGHAVSDDACQRAAGANTGQVPGVVSNIGMNTQTAASILEVSDLNFRYPEHVLFSQWSASVQPGVTSVLGGDGRGKTTLLRLLAGELAADAGELRINGIDLKTHSTDYRQQVFWTEPRTTGFDQMTPAHYLDLQRSTYAGFDEEVLARCVEGLALTPELHKQLFMLSTGSKRKVWLSAAFASGAALTLLDMPFAALDKASIGFVLERLQDAAAKPNRAYLVADYAAPANVRLAGVIDLGD